MSSDHRGDSKVMGRQGGLHRSQSQHHKSFDSQREDHVRRLASPRDHRNSIEDEEKKKKKKKKNSSKRERERKSSPQILKRGFFPSQHHVLKLFDVDQHMSHWLEERINGIPKSFMQMTHRQHTQTTGQNNIFYEGERQLVRHTHTDK